jgi:hypothetical protein
MDKREQKKLDELMQQFSQVNGTPLEELQKQVESSRYSNEELMYEAQSVLNFYEARIRPYIEKGEQPENFDKRYREWRIRTCRSCGEEFAYAWAFDGVTCCSLECVEAELAKIGLRFSWHKDFKRRYGFTSPAIVPSSAFATLRTAFQDYVPDVFSSYESDRPIPQVHHVESHIQDTSPEQDNPNNNVLETQR